MTTEKKIVEILEGQLGQIQTELAKFSSIHRDDMNQLYKELKEVRAEISQVKTETGEIKIQTTKTNGRVTRLEEHTGKCPVVTLSKDLIQIQDQVYDIIEEKKLKDAVEATKDTTEFKFGSFLKTSAIVAGWIVGIGALLGSLIYVKDLL